MAFAGLDAALSGLRVSQQQLGVISNNVANVSTPGFTRKILPQSSQAIQGNTVGVIGETIIRIVDTNLQRDLWTQVSSVGELEVQQTYLNRIQQFHGPPDQELSFASDIARLQDAFAALAESPEDGFLQASTVRDAVRTADKINEFADLLTTLRNDAQDDMQSTVARINDLLGEVSELNIQIRRNLNIGRTVAQLEDNRDVAVQELANLIDISFFKRGDGVLVIQTQDGVQLADERVTPLTFRPQPTSPLTYYPESVAGVFVGDPATNPVGAVDITARNVGGKLGGLIQLRDETLPQQIAQLDEVAHKMALRFDAQGLTLFTDSSGTIPDDTVAPDPTADPVVSVSYVGFSTRIQVNETIINDNSLIQSGTNAALNVQPSSSEVIRRVIDFVFTDTDHQLLANNNPNTSVTLTTPGAATLQNWLGLTATNQVSGGLDLSATVDLNTLIANAGGALADPNDQFEIILGGTNVLIDLSVAAGGAGANAGVQLVNHINAQITGAAAIGTASLGPSGELVLNSSETIQIDSTTLGTGIGPAGLNFLGLSDSNGVAQQPTQPYFDIQVGNGRVERVTIDPTDDENNLLAKLNALDGVAAQLAPGGFLQIRPGNDFTDPDFGGDIKIIGGPFQVNGAAYAAAGPPPRTTLDNGISIVSALFGTYTNTGGIITDQSPLQNIDYQSQISVTNTNTIGFRENFLGPGANISTGVIASSGLIDFAQKVINQQSNTLNLQNSRLADEETFRATLEQQLLGESGVNIDQELSNLIIVQTAYSASARVINAVDELFQELLNAV